MTIEPNKFYRTRSGHKARIYAVDAGGQYSVHGAILDHEWSISTWTPTGVYGAGVKGLDLVAEWTDRPEVDWSQYPAAVKFVAMDPDGDWIGIGSDPRLTGLGWVGNGALGVSGWPFTPPKFEGNWRDSLCERPSEG